MLSVGITGGSSFTGRRLVPFLFDCFPAMIKKVVLLDVKPHDELPKLLKQYGDKLVFTQCDITNFEQMKVAMKGLTSIIHIASYGMSGIESLQTLKIMTINVHGTQNIINLCVMHGIEHLIYLSTYNVVFDGVNAINGGVEEELAKKPIYPLDTYSQTKQLAERSVINANGTPLYTGRTLYTCSIRPAGIYGPGEERHIPRILRALKYGGGLFGVGSKEVLGDWLYVDNLCYSLCLAYRSLLYGTHKEYLQSSYALTSPRHMPSDTKAHNDKYSAAGQVYFISDNKPMNNFSFMYDIFHNLDYRYLFIAYLPSFIMYFLGIFFELFYALCAPLGIDIPPLLLTRAEVRKVDVTHWMSIKKAEKELNYSPIISYTEAIGRTVIFYRKLMALKPMEKFKKYEQEIDIQQTIKNGK